MRQFARNAALGIAATLLFAVAPRPAFAQSEAACPAPASQPAVALEAAVSLGLTSIGYHEPSRFDRLSENEPSVTLDFVDADHVLLTFNPKKLFQRLPGCTPDHSDRVMRAVILELPSGEIVRQTDWYLHDRRRYLWPFGPGKFLLRRSNDLYLVDRELHETRLFTSPKNLLWVAVTPDAGQIVVETAKDSVSTKGSKPPAEPGAKTGVKFPEAKYDVQFLDAKTFLPLRTIPLADAINLTGLNSGYIDLVHKEKTDVWLLRFGATSRQRRNLARVRSRTVPHIFYSSENSFLVGRCPAPNCDYSVTAFTIGGHRLWAQHWPSQRYFPSVASTLDHSRFAVSTLRLVVDAAVAKAAAQPDGQDNAFHPDASQLDFFQQQVQVFDTVTGASAGFVNVLPAMLTGQNFSISPDGRRLAVLQGSVLQLFNLAPQSSAEQRGVASLQSDIPDLYTLGSEDSLSAADGAVAATDEPPASGVVASSLLPDSEQRPAAAASPNPSSSSEPDATAAASPPTTSEPIPTIRVVTRAVVVDVVVTDHKGHPVHGLHPQDFQLAEDGKPQRIRNFQEFNAGTSPDHATPSENKDVTASAPATSERTPGPQTNSAASKPGVTAAAKPSPNVFSNQSHVPDTGAVTLILFDLLNTPSQDQSFARQQLIKFLQAKPKNTQIALCTLSTGDSRLRLIQGFTADETLLLAAAKGRKGVPKAVRWQSSEAEAANSVSTVNTLAQEGATSGFQGLASALQQMQAEQQVTDTGERSGYTLDAMMLLSRYLSGIPGRKNLVWLSGSFPISILATTSSSNPSIDNPNYTYSIKRVTNMLADAQVAVYPVDVRGLMGGGPGAGSAGDMGGPAAVAGDLNAGSIIAPAAVIPPGMQAFAQEAAERDTLVQFASETGGKAFYNTNGIGEAISVATDQGSNYYTLTYTPTNNNYDGKFRKIKIAHGEMGYTLHYRLGYFADDTNTAARDAELARRSRATAMQHGSPPSRQLVFTARVVPVGTKKKIDRALVGEVLLASAKKMPPLPAQIETQHISIDYSLAGSELRFIPLQTASYRSTLTLMVSSFDADGRMLTGIANVGMSDLQPALYKSVITGEFAIHQEADVPAAAASLRLGIQDQMSNHIGTVDIPLPLPPAPGAPRHNRQPLPAIEPD